MITEKKDMFDHRQFSLQNHHHKMKRLIINFVSLADLVNDTTMVENASRVKNN